METIAIRTKKAAELLDVSEIFLKKKRAVGQGPKYYKRGRVVLYTPESLKRWVEVGE